jgi:2-keto-4-pentenoate hydratase/2-oxohepta-3-ene-1,7-dioic acid hydratase in catechol pathway
VVLTEAGKVADLATAFFKQFRRPHKFRDLLDFLRADGMERVRELNLARLKNERDVFYPLEDVEVMAPIARPPKIVCVGLNYRDHAKEQNKPTPESPLLFMKAPNIVIGPEDEVRIPRAAPEKVDYEVELAVVIGRAGFEIPRARAGEHIFGYTIMNDVTARDLQASEKQWFRAKSFATFAPMGPHVVTRDELGKNGVAVELRLNGSVMQSGSTKDMVFDPEYLVEYVSACFPLEVGDVISTGTPAGVGVFREPPVFIKPGDEIEAEIEGIGVLRNRVV